MSEITVDTIKSLTWLSLANPTELSKRGLSVNGKKIIEKTDTTNSKKRTQKLKMTTKLTTLIHFLARKISHV